MATFFYAFKIFASTGPNHNDKNLAIRTSALKTNSNPGSVFHQTTGKNPSLANK